MELGAAGRARAAREQLDAHHQDDQQNLKAHGPVGDAIGAERQGERRADGDAGVRDAAAKRVGRIEP